MFKVNNKDTRKRLYKSGFSTVKSHKIEIKHQRLFKLYANITKHTKHLIIKPPLTPRSKAK